MSSNSNSQQDLIDAYRGNLISGFVQGFDITRRKGISTHRTISTSGRITVKDSWSDKNPSSGSVQISVRPEHLKTRKTVWKMDYSDEYFHSPISRSQVLTFVRNAIKAYDATSSAPPFRGKDGYQEELTQDGHNSGFTLRYNIEADADSPFAFDNFAFTETVTIFDHRTATKKQSAHTQPPVSLVVFRFKASGGYCQNI